MIDLLVSLLAGVAVTAFLAGVGLLLYLDSEARADARSIRAFEEEREAMRWDRR